MNITVPDQPVMIYVTAASDDEARTIATALVEERLVACANVLGPMTSFFWWEGSVQSESETALILKTMASRSEAVVDRVKALHSYSCPCVTVQPLTGGNPEFLAWIDRETR